jgi:hypothetical protein
VVFRTRVDVARISDQKPAHGFPAGEFPRFPDGDGLFQEHFYRTGVVGA